MAFSPVPKESRNQINKAGEFLLVHGKAVGSDEWEQAWDLVNRWRSCHAYPINTFQATLRTEIRKNAGLYKVPIIAQRLKRMPTIIDKLSREPFMKLTTMQDIAGVRAILATVKDVKTLVNSYKTKTWTHDLTNEKDYIQFPRSEDGYRGIHLIYKYKNKQNPAYDGLRLELQVRTKLQHIWATAVETMGTFLGQALKSRQGDKEWIDFFAITSSAFAYMEKSPLVPRFNSLSKEQTYKAVAKAEAGLRALEKMQGFSVAVELIVKSKKLRKKLRKRGFYHLIILDSLNKTVQVQPYRRDSFRQAMEAYSKVEEDAVKNGSQIEPVLVSAGSLDGIQHAYPNFFLDIRAFTRFVNNILLKATIMDKGKMGESSNLFHNSPSAPSTSTTPQKRPSTIKSSPS